MEIGMHPKPYHANAPIDQHDGWLVWAGFSLPSSDYWFGVISTLGWNLATFHMKGEAFAFGKKHAGYK